MTTCQCRDWYCCHHYAAPDGSGKHPPRIRQECENPAAVECHPTDGDGGAIETETLSLCDECAEEQVEFGYMDRKPFPD